MANSDNVLRAGLTPKYIDIAELLANVKFIPSPYHQLLTQPQVDGNTLNFPIPVADFAFSIHTLSDTPVSISQSSAAILFCIDGEATIATAQQQLVLQPGESCFIAANEPSPTVSGSGRLARVYNAL